MDTHITDLPSGTLSTTLHRAHAGPASAAGFSEGDEPTSGDAPTRLVTPDPSDRPGSERPDRRRRPLLLAGATTVMMAAAGGAFLISPYNTIYPFNAARLETQGRHIVASARQRVEDLVAPAAKVAHAPSPQVTVALQRPRTKTPTQDEQLREIIALRDRSPPAFTPGDAVPTPGTPPLTGAGPEPSRKAGTTGSVEPDVPGKPAVTSAIPLPVTPTPIAVASPSPLRSAADAAAADPTALRADQTPVLEIGAAAVPQPSLAPQPSAALAPSESLTSQQPGATGQDRAADPAAAGTAALSAKPDLSSAQAATPTPSVPARPQPAPLAEVNPRRSEPPTDAVAMAIGLRASPMTPPQQVEVLNVVANLAIIVRDIRAENAALKKRVENTADRFDQAVVDFDRRLALAEARGALSAAMGGEPLPAPAAGTPARGQAGTKQPSLASTGTPRGASPTATRVVPVSAVVPSAGVPAAAVRYRVTAASPGLAMLALLDRSGGEGSQIQVAVGDQVPGYGRVTAIQQRGASWVVQTDKGPDKGVIQ